MRKQYVFVSAVALFGALFLLWASFGYPLQVTVCEPNASGENCHAHYIPVGIVRWVLFQLDRYSVLLTAIFTGFIAWFTYSLRESTDKMWSVANAGLELTKLDMGAEMVLKQATVRNVLTRPKITVDFINSGRTRAIGVECVCSMGFRQMPVSDDDFSEGDTLRSRADVGPQRSAINDFTWDNPLSAAERAFLAKGNVAFFVYGRISYATVFSPDIITKRFRFGVGGPYGPLQDGAMAVCETGNS